MSPRTPAPKKVAKKLVEHTVTTESLAKNPEWLDADIEVGDTIEIEEGSLLPEDAPATPATTETEDSEDPAPATPPAITEDDAPPVAAATTEEVTKKEVVKSRRGSKTSSKATVKKAKENQKVIDDLIAPIGNSAKFEVVTRIKTGDGEFEIGEIVTLPDSKATRRLIEIGCIKLSN